MRVPVIFSDESWGTIQGDQLDELLERRLIIGFRRASGWAMVGKDELRSNRGDHSGSWRDRKCNRLLMSMQSKVEEAVVV
ncbi:MAG: hypothetical protein HXX11_14185 [Desulfuromonadales bacterium]|nr:hypothetical protein [Desulfuromonadales bacterium]